MLPQQRNEVTLSMSHQNKIQQNKRTLVKTSTTLSMVEIYCASKFLTSNIFMNKRKSISMCCLLPRKMGSVKRYVTPMLSHQNVGCVKRKTWISQRCWSHVISMVP